MARTRIEHRGSYDAIGSDGRHYTIEKWVTVVEVSDSESGGYVEKDGLADYKTSDGSYLNRLDTSRFQAVTTRLIVTANQPVP